MPLGAFGANRAKLDGLHYDCIECRREYGRRWREKNRDKDRAASQRWRDAHPDRARERVEVWRAANPDRRLEQDASYRERNREVIRPRAATWAQKWRANNRTEARSRARVLQNRRRAKLLAAFVEDVYVEALFERDNGLCGICGLLVTQTDWSVDHVVPLSKGGEHSYANTQLTHLICNVRKNNRIKK